MFINYRATDMVKNSPLAIYQYVGLVRGYNFHLSIFFTKTAVFPVKTAVFRLSDISVFNRQIP